ncbi:MAG: ABC transporter permease, partial [Vicinamibacterales bacterium]
MTDLRLAFRMMVKQPGMSLLAIVALALGIGLTTTMFSIVNGAFLRGLPFEESDRIYVLSRLDMAESDRTRDEAGSLHDYVDWRARQQSFEDLAAFYQGTANVVGPYGTPGRYRGVWLTPNTFRVLRATPVLGRDFRDGEEKPGAEGFYFPIAQHPLSFSILVHAAGPPTALTGSIREAVRAVDPNMPVFGAMTLEEAKNQNTWPFRVFGSLFMAFGFAALFLATVGLYGVMAFSVSKRTQEI